MTCRRKSPARIALKSTQRTNVAWFGEESFYGNKAARFNMETESFQEYPLLTEKARPHTGAVASDGRYWVALAHTNDPAKLASVDPETGEVKQYYLAGKESRRPYFDSRSFGQCLVLRRNFGRFVEL